MLPLVSCVLYQPFLPCVFDSVFFPLSSSAFPHLFPSPAFAASVPCVKLVCTVFLCTGIPAFAACLLFLDPAWFIKLTFILLLAFLEFVFGCFFFAKLRNSAFCFLN